MVEWRNETSTTANGSEVSRNRFTKVPSKAGFNVPRLNTRTLADILCTGSPIRQIHHHHHKPQKRRNGWREEALPSLFETSTSTDNTGIKSHLARRQACDRQTLCTGSRRSRNNVLDILQAREATSNSFPTK